MKLRIRIWLYSIQMEASGLLVCILVGSVQALRREEVHNREVRGLAVMWPLGELQPVRFTEVRCYSYF
jgi:hypothetical protein